MTQNAKITSYLFKGRTLTEAQARAQLGVTNLSARVHELRKRGVQIRTVSTKTGKTAYAI